MVFNHQPDGCAALLHGFRVEHRGDLMNLELRKQKARERVRLWRLKNPEGYRNWYLKNLEKQRSRARKRYWGNRQKNLAYASSYRKIHKEEIAAKIRSKYIPHPRPKVNLEEKRKKAVERATKWIHENRDRYNARQRERNKKFKVQKAAWSSERRALKIMAMPPWVDRKAIGKIYLECSRVTLITGIVHHVDHIWPLKGKGFVGLHVPWNLKIIPGHENRRKWNKRPDEYLKKC